MMKNKAFFIIFKGLSLRRIKQFFWRVRVRLSLDKCYKLHRVQNRTDKKCRTQTNVKLDF